MSESDLIDVYSTKQIVYKDSKWQVKKITVRQKFNPLMRRWKKIEVNEEILPISAWEPSLVKSIETQLVFKRMATDTNTLLPLEAWFSQKVKISANVNNPHEFLNQFEGKIFLHDLSVMTTQVLSMRDERVKRIGKPKRIAVKDVKALIEKGTQVYEQRGNELIINISP